MCRIGDLALIDLAEIAKIIVLCCFMATFLTYEAKFTQT